MAGAAKSFIASMKALGIQPDPPPITDASLLALTDKVGATDPDDRVPWADQVLAWWRQEQLAAAEREQRVEREAQQAVAAPKTTAELILHALQTTAGTVQPEQPSSAATTIPLNGAGVLNAVIAGLGGGTINGG